MINFVDKFLSDDTLIGVYIGKYRHIIFTEIKSPNWTLTEQRQWIINKLNESGENIKFIIHDNTHMVVASIQSHEIMMQWMQLELEKIAKQPEPAV